MFKKKLKKDIEKKADNYYQDIGILADYVLNGIIDGGALAKAIITTLSRYGRINSREVSYRYKLAQESLSRHKTEVKSIMVKVLSEIMSGSAKGSSGTYDYGNSGYNLNSEQSDASSSDTHEDSITNDMSQANISQDGSGVRPTKTKEDTQSGQGSDFASALDSANFGS